MDIDIKLIGSWGVIFFAFWFFLSLLSQTNKIWKSKSGKSISIVWFLYKCFFLLILFVYGLQLGEPALIISGLSGALVRIPILLGLWKFQGFSKKEKYLLFLLPFGILMMVFLPWTNVLLLIFSWVAIIPLISQPWIIWKKQDVGVVDIRLIIVSNSASFFWILYSFAIDSWPLIIMESIFQILWLLTLMMWMKFRTQKKQG